MGHLYVCTYQVASVTTAKTLAYLTAPATGILTILDTYVTQGATDTDDRAECAWNRIATLGSPTSTAAMAVAKIDPLSPAATFTARGSVTASEPTYDTGYVEWKAWSVLAGYAFEPRAGAGIVVAGGTSIGLRTLVTVSSAHFNVSILVEAHGA